MKRLLVALTLAIAGCGFTPEGDAVKALVADKGAQAYDEGLANAEYFICYAASYGAVKRRYGSSQERADMLRTLCEGQGNVDLVTPVTRD